MNWDILLAAMIMVESGGDPLAEGDGGASWGALQIQMGVVQDVNRWYGTEYDSYARYSVTSSKMIAKRWLTKRMRDAGIATGLAENYEMAARLWNGGYRGYLHNRRATDNYWAKVKKEIENF